MSVGLHDFFDLCYNLNMRNEKKKKIGILGGNFNPVHFVHLMLADQALQDLNLDQVWLMPEYLPPHVDEKETIAASHRIAMLELAIEGNPHLALELGEIERKGKSYTFDSLSVLTAAHPDMEFYFIIGSDMVDYLPKWYRIDELMQMVQFVAFKREDVVNESAYPVLWIEAPVMSLSSTLIRQIFKDKRTPNYLLPASVIAYIKKNQLYQ